MSNLRYVRDLRDQKEIVKDFEMREMLAIVVFIAAFTALRREVPADEIRTTGLILTQSAGFRTSLAQNLYCYLDVSMAQIIHFVRHVQR